LEQQRRSQPAASIVEPEPAARRPGVNEISRLSDVQIRNANAANYYECARMKEEQKRNKLLEKDLGI